MVPQVACVLVDEAQFLSTTQVQQLHKLAQLRGVPVICYGLRAVSPGPRRLGRHSAVPYMHLELGRQPIGLDSRPSTTTAAAVSSHEVSIPRIRTIRQYTAIQNGTAQRRSTPTAFPLPACQRGDLCRRRRCICRWISNP